MAHELSNKIAEIERLCANEAQIDVDELRNAMFAVKKALNEAPHLVDSLMPEEIGTLVRAIRMQMTNDLLNSAAKTRKRSSTTRVRVTAEDLKNANVDELFGGI